MKSDLDLRRGIELEVLRELIKLSLAKADEMEMSITGIYLCEALESLKKFDLT